MGEIIEVSGMHYQDSQIAAIIDLGSNTARAILMRFRRDHSYHLEDEIREMVRLRQGMSKGGLTQEAMVRGLSTIRLFNQYCESVGADVVIATATSAVREAANGAQLVDQVRDELGLRLRVLSGEEEAYYGVLGALHSVPLEQAVVVDVGGGSVQVSLVQKRSFSKAASLPLGALALTEEFVRSDPVKGRELRKIQQEIDAQLGRIEWWPDASGPLVGMGGTIRNLAKIEAKRRGFPLHNINGFVLTLESLHQSISEFRKLPLRKRRRTPGLSRDRADIILPGAVVVRSLMQRLGVHELTVSRGGIREGLFLEQFFQHMSFSVTSDLRDFSVLNLARFYRFQEKHAHHVRYLCGRLFDQLQPLHELGAREKEILQAAALLHDIGSVVSYNDHHKYSEMLISANGLPGFSPRCTALIALLARYHRKGNPSLGAYKPLLVPGDRDRVSQLAAMLRLAEYVERGRTGLVRDIDVSWDEGELTLTLIAEAEPRVEMWSARRMASDLLESAFGRTVRFESRKPDEPVGGVS